MSHTKNKMSSVDATQYNQRSPAVKRLLREAAELSEATPEFYATPLEDNLFEWHFTIRGPPESEFEVGIYHGRIIFPPDYPMKPPSFIMMTPNGRFETGTKICLSISSYHPETWRPSWSIRTAILALISFMSVPSPGAIGSLEYSADSRKALARKSLAFECPVCGPTVDLVKYRPCSRGQVGSSGRTVPKTHSVQTVFRIPHAPDTNADNGNRNPIPQGPNADIRAGDSEMFLPREIIEPDVPQVMGEGIPMMGMDRDVATLEFPSYGMTISVLVIAISGLVLRRLFNFFLDDDE